MSVKQWAEAEALWEAGDITLEQLAAKFGRHRSTFHRHFTEKKIKRGSSAEAHKATVKTAVAAAAVDEHTVLAARIRETKEDHYKMSSALAKLTWQEVLKAREDGRAMATILGNVKALEIVANTLKKIREERFTILGLDKSDFIDEDGLPELVISELSAEQVEALKARDEADLDMDLELVQVDESGKKYDESEDDLGDDDDDGNVVVVEGED